MKAEETELVRYRLARAKETLQEARLLSDSGYYNALTVYTMPAFMRFSLYCRPRA